MPTCALLAFCSTAWPRVIWIVVLLLSLCFFDRVHKYKDKCIPKPDTNNQSRAGDSDSRRRVTPLAGGALHSFAREVFIPHLETHLGWNCPVVNVTTFIVVKAGIVDVEKIQCWHRDINLSYVTGPDQHHVICWFPMFHPTPSDGCAGDFVVASHTGLPDPWYGEHNLAYQEYLGIYIRVKRGVLGKGVSGMYRWLLMFNAQCMHR